MWEKNIDRLPLAHTQPGTWPATQACALTGNVTDSSVCWTTPNPMSYTSQGYFCRSLRFPLRLSIHLALVTCGKGERMCILFVELHVYIYVGGVFIHTYLILTALSLSERSNSLSVLTSLSESILIIITFSISSYNFTLILQSYVIWSIKFRDYIFMDNSFINMKYPLF